VKNTKQTPIAHFVWYEVSFGLYVHHSPRAWGD